MIKIENDDEAQREKCQFAWLDDENEDVYAAGGKWEGDYLRAGISRFRNYVVAIDTIPPKINPVNISTGKNISGQSAIKTKITDRLVGIQDFLATMNGEWILMEWDPKSSLLKYNIDHRTIKGKNRFGLTVTDGRINEKIYEAELIR